MTQTTMETSETLKARKVELVMQQLDSLPTLPAIAVRLLSLTGAADAKVEEVAQLLSGDPSLAGKVLSLVQSAAQGTRRPVTSIKQAVVMLGFEAVRNLVLSVKVFEVFSTPRKDADAAEPSAFARAEFWKHSLATATAAELIASKLKTRVSPQDAFVCGLLHDIGKVAFDTVMPKSFSRVCEVATMTRCDIADVERRIIGLDHAIAGKRLAEAWNLPTLIVQSIWLHGAGPTAIKQGVTDSGLIHVVALADILARRQHLGFSGNYLYPYDASLYQHALGLSDADLQAVIVSLAEELEKRARAIGLYDIDSKTLYLEAIAQANTELAQVNQTLSAQNRKLASRAQCFELVTKLYQRIVPSASPAQLLAEIGRVSHEFLGAGRLVLFSQDPDQKIGEVLTFDATAQTQDSFLMQMPPAAGDMRHGRGGNSAADFLRPASPQLEWLLDRTAAFLGAHNCVYMPLLCGSDPVGGIVWVRSEQGTISQLAADLMMVAQSWGMTLRTAQVREQQNVLAESLAASNRELGLLQQQLVRAKSLSSVGEMAAGAAHEMNNPLAVMCGRAQLLASKLSDPTLKQDAALIAQQGERLSRIITDLMEFAKPEHPKIAPVVMANVVEDAVAAATARAGQHGVKVRAEMGHELPAIEVDAHQIRAAIAEVVLNAIQASRGSVAGEVLVQARYDTLDSQLIIQITDRGAGMSEETIRHVFSPFYSAKTAGRQRGMGLAKAMRWVEGHGGTIRLDSMVGAGTTAVIILPAKSAVGVAEAVR
jgi:putative nucleotidyltransferase with HDIG domain